MTTPPSDDRDLGAGRTHAADSNRYLYDAHYMSVWERNHRIYQVLLLLAIIAGLVLGIWAIND